MSEEEARAYVKALHELADAVREFAKTHPGLDYQSRNTLKSTASKMHTLLVRLGKHCDRP